MMEPFGRAQTFRLAIPFALAAYCATAALARRSLRRTGRPVTASEISGKSVLRRRATGGVRLPTASSQTIDTPTRIVDGRYLNRRNQNWRSLPARRRFAAVGLPRRSVIVRGRGPAARWSNAPEGSVDRGMKCVSNEEPIINYPVLRIDCLRTQAEREAAGAQDGSPRRVARHYGTQLS
jgi:hypothetical protein